LPCAEIYEATTEEGLYAALTSIAPDLLVINQKLITDVSALPEGNIVILGTEFDSEKLCMFRKYGIHGYLSEESPVELLHYMLLSSRQEFLLDPVWTGILLESLPDNVLALQKEKYLTEREREIAMLMESGMNRRDVARELCIAENTLKTHLKNIARKRRDIDN
jgi:DNA-binding NarL/FixJ family response regulator